MLSVCLFVCLPQTGDLFTKTIINSGIEVTLINSGIYPFLFRLKVNVGN